MATNKSIIILLFLQFFFFNGYAQSTRSMSLAGVWKFAADPLDKGIPEKWFAKELSESISLPGSMTSNGKAMTSHFQHRGLVKLLTARFSKVLNTLNTGCPEILKYPSGFNR